MKERKDPNSGKQTHLDPIILREENLRALPTVQWNIGLSLESGNAASFLLYALGLTHLNMFS